MTSASSAKLSTLFPNAQDATQGDAIPEPVMFVEDLADRLATEFPDLWKLGQVKISTILGFLKHKLTSARQANFYTS